MAIRTNKAFINTCFLWFTFMLSAFPILTFGLRSIVIVLWAVIGVLSINFERKKKYVSYLIISILPFIYLSFTLLYSQNSTAGIKRLIQMLPFLIFPLVFYLNKDKFNKEQINKTLWCFSISVILLVFYQIVCSLFRLDYLLADLTNEEIVRNRLSNQDLLNQDVISSMKTKRFRNYLIELTDTHFTYQGMWVIFSVFFLFKEGIRFLKKKRYLGFLLIIISIILVVWLFFISSRMPILTMFIALFCTVFVFKKIKFKLKILLLGLSILVLISSYFTFTTFKARVDEIVNIKFDLPSETKDTYNYDSINVRHGIYVCAAHLVKDNFWFGVGVGDSQDALNSCYNEKIGAKIYTWQDYNTHNQYLYFALATGIFGLFFYLILLYLQHKEALKYKNELYLYFIIVVALISLTENILSRSDGVMFFAFFSGLFLFNSKNRIK
ncbi:hypothetical protein FUA26_04190 [Seonamhaeicola algicola]|uniref:O-antigen ligase-related domain-containing protein n=1 Tax=Seonamhaeicola algicola TaxID=1719036 RepID=A0A5C7B575_9FLAO|nr:O-antigen ligase family protein [Seonamhaeicola algicola]TXE13002.1 hypothetical protein FUA26_04190 [Seonamhaeicola algicola]